MSSRDSTPPSDGAIYAAMSRMQFTDEENAAFDAEFVGHDTPIVIGADGKPKKIEVEPPHTLYCSYWWGVYDWRCICGASDDE